MFDFTCLDRYGNILRSLTQWDINQTIIIKDSGLTIAPQFHFCNTNTKQALIVQSSIDANGTITVPIPNQLTIEPYNITAYIYMVKGDSGKTLETIQLPLRPRIQPDNFVYENNIS